MYPETLRTLTFGPLSWLSSKVTAPENTDSYSLSPRFLHIPSLPLVGQRCALDTSHQDKGLFQGCCSVALKD